MTPLMKTLKAPLKSFPSMPSNFDPPPRFCPFHPLEMFFDGRDPGVRVTNLSRTISYPFEDCGAAPLPGFPFTSRGCLVSDPCPPRARASFKLGRNVPQRSFFSSAQAPDRDGLPLTPPPSTHPYATLCRELFQSACRILVITYFPEGTFF